MNVSTNHLANRLRWPLLATFLVIALLAGPCLRAQCDGVCGMSCLPPALQPLPWDPSQPRDGLYITSRGILNVMMVFVDFPDDPDSANPLWPVGAGPTFAGGMIDPAPNATSGRKYNLTTFFHDMSGGKLTVIGHPYYVQAPKPRTRYENSAKNDGSPETVDQSTNVPHFVNRDVLAILDARLDSNDWKQYDTWTFRAGANYTHKNIPDGRIDLIVMCYRNYYNINTQKGYRGEGFPDLGLAGPPMVVGKGSNRIVFADVGDLSSGVTCFNAINYPLIDLYVHEMGHYLLGTYEEYNPVNGGLWSLLGERHTNVSLQLHALQRYQLGWGEFVEVDSLPDGAVAEIPDYGTTRIAYRSTPGPPHFNDLVFENHQGLPSPWITDPQGTPPTYDVVDMTGGPGLYVIENRRGNPRVVCADGRWRWEQDSQRVADPRNPDYMQPIFRKGAVDRVDGETDRQPHRCWHRGPVPGAGIGLAHNVSWFDERTGALRLHTTLPYVPGARYRGDGCDRWTPEGDNVFSPWSNPATYADENPRRPLMLAMEVLPPSGTNAQVKFFPRTPLLAPPSRPQAPAVSLTGQDTAGIRHPAFTWELNIEPDMVAGGLYEVWRCDSAAACNWSLIATVGGGVGTYVDTSVVIDVNLPQASRTLRYKVRAQDTQGLKSSYTEERLVVLGAPILKRGVGVPESAVRAQVTPNPSRDGAVLRYGLPRAGWVRIEVYDIGGRLAAVAHEGAVAGGEHEAALAEGLPPGAYFWLMTFEGSVKTGQFIVAP